MAERIDGAGIARALDDDTAAQIAAMVARGAPPPGLAVVLVGQDPASEVYVSHKVKACAKVGIASFAHRLPADTPQAELLALIARLNRDPAVHGILCQVPLPAHIDTDLVLQAIDPDKDVDGFHPLNAGRLATGVKGLVPCTPQGVMILL